MDSSANSVGESVGESPAPAPAPAPETETETETQIRSAEPVTKGRGLRRWRRIPREQQHHEGSSPASPGAGASAGEDLAAQLHKRRYGPAAADEPPKGKQDAAAAAAEEAESSVASVESTFVPPLEAFSPPPAPAPALTRLDPNLGHLIATAGFSVGAGGADSDNSDDRASKLSTAASAPRHDFSSVGFGRDRDRARSRAPGAAHGKGVRAARARGASARVASSSPAEAENSRSSVESSLRSSNAAHARRSSAAGVTSNGVHKVLFPDDGHQSDDEPPSAGLRYSTGGFYKENGSLVGRLGNGDSDSINHIFDEASVGKFENGGTHSGLDPYAESIALLQSAQEALENEIQKFVEIREGTDEDSTSHQSEIEWSSSPVEELNEKIKMLELKLEEATTVINKQDSKILELDAFSQVQPQNTIACNNDLLSLQSDVDQLLLEKMEAEIQCFILTRASHDWKLLAMDQFVLDEAQKSLSADHKSLEIKLAENRAIMLEEMVDKLESQCKELSETSEVLKLQARASRASLFCSIQFVMLCIAIGTLLVRFLPSSPEIVPT